MSASLPDRFLARKHTLCKIQTWQIGIASYLQTLSMILSKTNCPLTESLLMKRWNVSSLTSRCGETSSTATDTNCWEEQWAGVSSRSFFN